ncbi:Endonuclease/exonuclease/phosphatase [Fagus crenata]
MNHSLTKKTFQILKMTLQTAVQSSFSPKRRNKEFMLLGDLLGKSLGYKYLDYKICAIWKLIGDMQCIDLGHDFFLTCLKLNEDYSKVVNGGPWFIGQQFLTLCRWTPGFRPSEAKISTTAVWARLPELPIEFNNKTMLRRIGTQLGTLLKIDARTMDNEHGHFARVCVQIDLDQPLTAKIRIGNHDQKIQYEGISTICFECGYVGHRASSCPSIIILEPNVNPITDPLAHKPIEPPSTEDYGEWMLVTKKRSKPKATATKKPANPSVILKQHDPYIKLDQPHSSQPMTSPPDGLPPTQLRPHPQQRMDQRCFLSRNDATV